MDPIDDIIAAKRKIDVLSELQDQIFDDLTDSLPLTMRGKDYLFDYLFNENSKTTFVEYLSRFDKSVNDIIVD